MLSRYGANLLADALTGQATLPATLHIAILSTAPTATQSGTDIAAYEPTDVNYARYAITMDDTEWSAATDGAFTNLNLLEWANPDTDWGNVAYYAFCTAATAGEVFFAGQLSYVTFVGINRPLYIPPSGFTVSFLWS